MRFSPRLAVLLTVLVLGTFAFALEPFTLGPVYKLGTVTQANLPVLDGGSLLVGGLVYVTDDGGAHISDGTNWLKLATGGSSSGDSFFFDAGPHGFSAESSQGYIRTDNPIAEMSDGGPIQIGVYVNAEAEALAVGNYLISGFSAQPYLGLHRGAPFRVSNLEAALMLSGSTGQLDVWGNSRVRFVVGGATPAVGTLQGSWASRTLTFSQAASSDAFLFTTGARAHLGGGTNDYFLSDGTGIETPGYIESTIGISSRAGLYAAGVCAAGAGASSLTIGSAANQFTGTFSMNTTDNRMMLFKGYSTTGPNYMPLQPNVVAEKQTFSTRVISSTATGYPELVEKVNTGVAFDGGVNPVQMYATFTGGVTGAAAAGSSSLGRSLYAVTTGTEVNARYYTTTATVDTPTTLYGIASARLSPSWCQWVRTPSTLADLRLWAGLTTTLPTTGTSTMTGDGAMFRLDSTVDGNFYICSRDGTTQTCTSTGVAAATSTNYLLCVNLDASRNIYAWVNGVYTVTHTTNLPTATVMLAPMLSAENLTAGVGTAIAYGVLQVETL